MDKHSDIVERHNSFLYINRNKEIIENILKNIDLSEEFVEELRRISFILTSLELALKKTNSNFISKEYLDNLEGPLEEVLTDLKDILRNPDTAYLSNARDHIDELVNLSGLNKYYFNKETSDANTILSSKIYKQLNFEITQLRKNLKETKEENHKLSVAIQQQKEQLNSIKKDLSRTLDNNQKQIDSNLQQLRDNNNNLLNTLENDFKGIMKGFRKDFADQEQKLSETGEATEIKAKQILEESSTKLNQYVEDAKKLLGYINQTSFSSKYKEVADNAKDRSLRWNVCVAASLGIAIIMAYYTLDAVLAAKYDRNLWVFAFARTIIIILMVSFTVYCAKQAEANNKVERYARKIEMELIAFDTFVDNLDEKNRTELKRAVVERIFINREDIIDEHSNPADSLDIQKILEKFASKLEKKENKESDN